MVNDPICNLCGLSCVFEKDCYGPGLDAIGGLINAKVDGGYESTPGNGHGALDDGTSYHFSLCEFCLDWLFSQFEIPVKVDCYMGPEDIAAWRPAAQRVAEDDWRRMKDAFRTEYERRIVGRNTKRLWKI